MAARISEVMRDAAYEASIALAEEKGLFPPCSTPRSSCKVALPAACRRRSAPASPRRACAIATCCLSLPTGTITLALADNASSGIEPSFGWTAIRKVRKSAAEGKGAHEFVVEDHAYRVFKAQGGDVDNLPASFVTALEMSAMDHMLMSAAVQPFMDASISKTVNVPEDYPFADFENLYLEAFKANLKGITTYRPNLVTGSVLSTTPSTAPAVAAPAVPAAPAALADVDPLRVAMQRAPGGDLDAKRRQIKFFANGQDHTLYLNISFAEFEGVIDGKPVKIERPVEFFMEPKTGNGSQWLSSFMVQLSTSIRYGYPVADAIKNMRQQTWAHGLVQYGFHAKADGSKVPRFHDSDVAVVGYAIQDLLTQRGFLDADGEQVPARVLAEQYAARTQGMAPATVEAPVAAAPTAKGFAPGSGMKCPACGAHELHKKDGCTSCEACGHDAGCGG